MSTPAERLAAAHAAAAAAAAADLPIGSSAGYNDDDDFTASVPSSSATSGLPASGSNASRTVSSINDEEAFPALGTAPVGNSTASAWGPKMKKPSGSSTSGFAAAAANAAANTSSASASSNDSFKSVAMRSNLVQEAFSLDFESQLNINKTEFANILTNLKKTIKCNIECTSSQQTRKRTFLVTGTPQAIEKARKEIIRRLTKPVVIEFTIPASTRSVVIGAGGRNLKPILEAHGVKVNIDRDTTPKPETASDNQDDNNDDDIFGESAKVTIEGDIEGVNDAKAQILAIVDENTKSLTTKVKVDDIALPFIENDIKHSGEDLSDVDLHVSSKTGLVTITGPREKIADLRAKVKLLSSDLISKIATKEQVVPKKFHKFIDVEEIANDLNVIVDVPFEEEDSQVVKFIGDKSKLDVAIAKAKQSSKRHLIESLNIARAHNGNLKHGKYLGVYFKKLNVLENIAQDNEIQIHTPSYESLLSDSTKDVLVDFVFNKDTQVNFKTAKKQVIDLVNQYAPTSIKVISDIDSFFGNEVLKQTESLAQELSIKVIPFATLPTKKNKSGEILLVSVANEDEDDFGPSIDEINGKFDQIDASLSKFREQSKEITTETLQVPSAEQQHITGPSESTLRSLKSVVSNPLDIILHHPSDDEVSVHGLAKDVAKIVQEIKQVLQDAKDYAVASKYNTTLEFPSTVLARLIGKNGAQLNSLQEEYGIKIDVAKPEAAAASGAATSSVKITGIKRNAEEAKTKIAQLGKKWADETTSSLNVPPRYQRALIGAKGVYVHRLQDKYNVRIKFPHERKEDDENSDVVKNDEFIIRGPSKGVKKAYEELQELLNYEIENGHKTIISVPAASVSRIIGKNGNNLIALRDEFGVEINIIDKEGEERQVELTGSKSNIKQVDAKIKEIVKEVQNTITVQLEVDPIHYRAILGPNANNLRDILSKAKAPEDNAIRRRLLDIPDKGSDSKIITSTGDKKVVESIISQIKDIVAQEEKTITEDVDISQEKHRLIIGAGGSTRRTIETEYNVTVNVPRVNEHSTIVKVKGLPENVTKAKQHITKLIADNWSALVEVPAKYHSVLAQRGATFRKLRNDYNVKVEHGQFGSKATKLTNGAQSAAKVPEAAIGDEATESTKWTVVNAEDTADATSPDAEDVIPWRLVGNVEDANKAKAYLEAELSKIAKFNATGYLYVANRGTFSKIIGPKGATIEKLRKKTNTNITIPQAGADVNNVVVVEGELSDLEGAKDEILKLIGQ